jgi:hypothetical protein
MIGLIAIARDDRMPSKAQYAIGRKQGCLRILHKVRHLATEGKAVLRFDLTNAYGTASTRRN